jgi:dihydrofolate reductase
VIVSLIVAMSENGVIGRDGGLPWHLPDDLKRFKRLTMGHVLIMGRRTFASVGRPLPGRRTIVLSHDPAYRPAGVETAPSLEAAITLARGASEVFVAGGADVYRAALPTADRLYLTLVHTHLAGDAHFPPLDLDAWELDEEVRHPADERHAHAFTFRRYRRRRVRPRAS